MENIDTVVAVFADHAAAETAVKKLNAAGFEMKNSQHCRQRISHGRESHRILQRR